MNENRIINVSPSLLADVISCETKAWLRHKAGYTSSSDAIKAVAGQGFHAAIAHYLDPTCVGVHDVKEGALRSFHSVYDEPYSRLSADKLEPSLTPQNLDRVLRRWLEMHPSSQLPWKRVLMVEEAFVSREWTITLSDYFIPKAPVIVRLIVRPDLVVEDHNGKIRFVDTKTTGWHINDSSWRQALKLSLQVQLYADAVVQRFGEKAIYGGWINAIELRKLPGDVEVPQKLKKDGTPAKPRLCAEHGRPYAECGNEHAKSDFIECLTTPERVARAVEDARNAAMQFVAMQTADVTALNMHGTANQTCKFCPAARWCESSRPVEALSSWSDLVYSPWIIEEGKR